MGARYRISVRGSIPDSRRQAFGNHDLTRTVDEDGQVATTLIGWMEDQAALTGLFRSLIDFQLCILTVERLEEMAP